MKTQLAFTAPLLAALLATQSATAASWPAWRGPNGDGISTEQNLPVKWSKAEESPQRLLDTWK